MLQDAVQWQIISNNTCSRVKPPSIQKKPIPVLEEADIVKMLKCLENEALKYKTLISLAIDAGLRLGELMGLTWDDINFENKTLQVDHI